MTRRWGGKVRFARLFVCAVCLAGLVTSAGCTTRSASSVLAGGEPSQFAPVPGLADGLVFVHDSKVWIVRDGAAVEVAPGGDPKREVSRVIRGDGVAITTQNSGSAQVAVAVPGGSGLSKTIHSTDSASLLGQVRYDKQAGRLWRTEFGDPAARLVVTGAPANSAAETLPLTSFSGEFDLDPGGTTVVYTAAEQNPSQLLLYSGTTAAPLVAGFATLFTPSFSHDGGSVCFSGSRSPSDPVSLWVVNVRTKAVRGLSETSGLIPTWPVFSPDGTRIAFRSGKDGALWVVTLKDGVLSKLPLTASEAALAW